VSDLLAVFWPVFKLVAACLLVPLVLLREPFAEEETTASFPFREDPRRPL
jgi:hypothetical protein